MSVLDWNAGFYGMPGGGMLLLAGDSDGLVDRLELADDAEHEVGGVGTGTGKPPRRFWPYAVW